MIKMTEKEYDELESSIKAVSCEKGNWFPTEEEIDTIIRPNAKEYIPFIMWLLEAPYNKQDVERKKLRQQLYKIVYDTIEVLYDDEDGDDS